MWGGGGGGGGGGLILVGDDSGLVLKVWGDLGGWVLGSLGFGRGA